MEAHLQERLQHNQEGSHLNLTMKRIRLVMESILQLLVVGDRKHMHTKVTFTNEARLQNKSDDCCAHLNTTHHSKHLFYCKVLHSYGLNEIDLLKVVS